MDKKTITKLNALKKQMESSKKIIAKERDKLRASLDELNELSDLIDQGVDDLDTSFSYLQTSIDAFSQQM